MVCPLFYFENPLYVVYLQPIVIIEYFLGMQKNFCAVNSQLLFHENSFDSSPKNAFEQRLFRGSGSVHRLG